MIGTALATGAAALVARVTHEWAHGLAAYALGADIEHVDVIGGEVRYRIAEDYTTRARAINLAPQLTGFVASLAAVLTGWWAWPPVIMWWGVHTLLGSRADLSLAVSRGGRGPWAGLADRWGALAGDEQLGLLTVAVGLLAGGLVVVGYPTDSKIQVMAYWASFGATGALLVLVVETLRLRASRVTGVQLPGRGFGAAGDGPAGSRRPIPGPLSMQLRVWIPMAGSWLLWLTFPHISATLLWVGRRTPSIPVQIGP